jgi:hypothetical protein
MIGTLCGATGIVKATHLDGGVLMKTNQGLYHVCAMVCLVALSGSCLANDPNSLILGPQWIDPNSAIPMQSVTQTLGPEGGVILDPTGQISLTLPPQSLPDMYVITLTTRPAGPRDGDVLSPIVDVLIDPPLTSPLSQPAILNLGPGFPDANDIQVSRLFETPGSLFGVSDPNQSCSFSYWKPQWTTRSDGQDAPTTPLTSFGTFAPHATPLEYDLMKLGYPAPDDLNVPWSSALNPPPTPEGYTYVGTEVVEDFVYQPQFSSVPLNRPASPNDLVYIQSETSGQDSAADHDLIIAHVFAPLIENPPAFHDSFDPNAFTLAPPETPAGYVYVGRNVVVDSVLQEDLTTIPLDRDPQSTDMVFIQSETSVLNKTTEHDINIQHVFAPAPPVGDAPSECIPSEANLQPPSVTRPGYEYLGREVVINGQYQPGLSTAPLGRPHQQTDYIPFSSSTSTRNGQVVCDVIIAHIYARLDAQGQRMEDQPTYQELKQPPAPEGYVYVGRDVVINGVLSEEYSDLPLERPESPQEISQITSQTTVKDATVIRDVVVRHVFAPIQHAGCPIDRNLYPMPTLPPCHRYVGYLVVINHQLVDWSVPLQRPLYPTDLILISSKTHIVDGLTQCDTIVCHVFEQIPCPPRNTTVTFGGNYFAYESQGLTQLYVSSGNGQMSPADMETLKALSVQTPYVGHQGDITIALPPGTAVEQTGNQLTVTMPEGYYR